MDFIDRLRLSLDEEMRLACRVALEICTHNGHRRLTPEILLAGMLIQNAEALSRALVGRSAVESMVDDLCTRERPPSASARAAGAPGEVAHAEGGAGQGGYPYAVLDAEVVEILSDAIKASALRQAKAGSEAVLSAMAARKELTVRLWMERRIRFREMSPPAEDG